MRNSWQICVLILSALVLPAAAQDAPKPADSLFTPPAFRKLVPGVERSIDPERVFYELNSLHDVPELLQVDANFEWAKSVQFRHDIWALEFTFKPLRMVHVDLPGPGGKLERKLVWYMVYRVRNPGIVWHAEPTVYTEPVKTIKKSGPGDFEYESTGRDVLTDGVFDVVPEKKEAPIRFIPTFYLFSRDRDLGKKYLDRVLPVAVKPIQEREDINRKLLTTTEIMGDILASPEGQDRSVWGVVTWTDIDPRTDFLSIYVKGLSNAYKRQYIEGKGWWYSEKTLRIDFRRPGDEFFENEDEIRFLRTTWTYLDGNWAPKPESADAATPHPIKE